MQSKAKSVEAYLQELPDDRRAVVAALRQVIRDNLDADYEEGMTGGMIGYYVPHRIYPAGYHCDPKQPLPFASLAAQKQYFSVYLMGLYTNSPEEAWFRAEWSKTGKKLDMGKCCVRLKRLEDVPLDLIGAAIRRWPAKKYIAFYESVLQQSRSRQPAAQKKKPAVAKATVTKKAPKKSPRRGKS